MYIAKKEKFKLVKQKTLAETVGVTECTISRIIKKSKRCSKPLAFSIVKAIHPQAEIEEFFTEEKGE